MSINKLTPFTILLIGIAFLINSCDTSSPSVGNQNSDNNQEQFFAYADTASSLVNRAVGIFRDRNIKENFVQHFVDKKGLPAWDFSSSFTRDNKQILLIPVRQPDKEKVTGVYYFSFDKQGKRLDDDWIPREYEGKWIDKRALKTIILGYEQRLFGKKYTDEGAHIFNKENISNTDDGLLRKAPSVEQGQCYTTCVSYYCGDWYCEYYIDWGQSNDDWIGAHTGGGGGASFFGEIDATDLENSPKANCIYSKLSQTNALKNTLGEFAGVNTYFNLTIEVDQLESGVLGMLSAESGSTDFTMTINSRELGRTTVEIAGTFLHEAIHAEMRRYLYGATNASTLPGFPGDFSADWESFVNTTYDGDPSIAEHETMAARYVNTIADGLEEFGGGDLTMDEYEAIAWIGLRNTDYYTELLSDSERSDIESNINSAKQSANENCN